MIEPWTTLRRKALGDYKIFRLHQAERTSPTTGAAHTFHILEMPDWINVIPLTPEGEVVMIRQYRHGTETVTLEIPGGMADPEDGDIVEAARRELLEETGYAGDPLVSIGRVAPNPAIQDNYLHTFIAPNVRRIGPQDLQGAEEIAVEMVPLDDIPGLILAGRISHALVVSAFYLFDHHRRLG